MESISYPIRINHYLALKGYCSRREADALISQKQVKINDRVALLGDQVKETDTVVVAPKAMTQKRKSYVYIAYNKPVGIVSHSPEPGQKAIKDAIKIPADVVPVGRLDKDSHGLIILTNDGRITKRLLEPQYDHEKEYSVKVDQTPTARFLERLRQGVDIEGYMTKPCKVVKIDIHKFRITLTEGKKHQIRRMCSAMGYAVRDLRRIRVMNIKLGDLAVGDYRLITGQELADFLKSLELN